MDEDKVHLSQQMRKLVEDLVTSGSPTLNEERLKSLKKICRCSDFFILELYQLLMKYLKRKHAEIRLSTFQIMDEIFQKSHCFRQLVLKNLKSIAELTVTYDPKLNPLKPGVVAKKLRTIVIAAIHVWHEKFKDGYHSLKLGYNYLKECKNVDFEGLAVITEQDRERRAEERRKEEEIQKRRIDKVVSEMNEKTVDISTLLLEFNNAFKLLIPDLDDFFIPVELEKDGRTQSITENQIIECEGQNFEFGSDFMREHGLTKETIVQVNLSSIHTVLETPDNELIISTLKEKMHIINNNILPAIKGWEQSVIPYSTSHPELLKKIIDLKRTFESVIHRYGSVSIVPMLKKAKTPESLSSNVVNDFYGGSSDDDDDDFIEVPFDDPRVLQASASEAALTEEEMLSFKVNLLKTPINNNDLEAAGTSGSSTTKIVSKSSLPETKTDLSIDNFMEEKMEEPLKFQNAFTDIQNKWLANPVLHDHGEDILKSPDILGIATRAVDFERKWEPVRWACLAPLPTGRLCPRKDRECCPFHGPVVPRDSLGRPVHSEDIQMEQRRIDDRERANPAWQNPTLLAEIRAATGIDLDMKKARKNKRYSNLTDIKAQENNSYNRLKKKVFNKKSLKRVNEALAKLPP